MDDIAQLLVGHIDIWSSAKRERFSGRGRATGDSLGFYGVEKLRGLILDLAFQGKLTSQDSGDESVENLLSRIKAQKASEATKKVKKPRQRKEDFAFSPLPSGWTWVQLDDICSYIQRGKGPVYSDKSDLIVISQKCVRWSGLDLAQARFADIGTLEKYDEIRFLRAGDVLWNSTGTGTIGRACSVPELQENIMLVADSHVTVIRPVLVLSQFLLKWIQSPLVQSNISDIASGSTNQIELNISAVMSHYIPLPPLEEQARIVSKIDELLIVCDQLESQSSSLVNAHQILVKSFLNSLLKADNSNEFDECWKRIVNIFDILFTTEGSISELKQAILRLAIMGKLEPQITTEDSTELLMDDIRNIVSKLVADKLIRKNKDQSVVGSDEFTFTPPQGWKWVRLGQIGDWGAGATPLRGVASYYGGTIPWFKSGELSEDEIYESEETITELALEKCSLRLNKPGDVLLAMYGATIGKASILKISGTTNQAVCACTPYPGVSNEFLLLWLKAMRPDFIGQGVGGAQPNISREKIIATPIALPPKKEQLRIVKKVKEIIETCNELESFINRASKLQRKISDVLVEQVLN